MSVPKCLVVDIETLPMEVWVWELGKQYVGLGQLKKDWSIGAWSAKWLGDSPSKQVYYDQRNSKDPYNDKAILKPLWKLLDEANIVITQNGEKFDGPKLNAKFILQGTKPPSPYTHLDTYKIAHRVAAFTSHSLEYLTSKLCTKYRKLSHTNYLGLSLWKACLRGDMKAWDEMKKYNIHDVLSTEELYTKLEAWVPTTMPSPYVDIVVKPKCTYCSSYRMKASGVRGKYRRYVCCACGRWQQHLIEKLDLKEAA